jgi:hypothetical protein
MTSSIDLIVEEGAIEDRHDRLRRMNGERPQTRALAASEKNSLHDSLPSYTSEA